MMVQTFLVIDDDAGDRKLLRRLISQRQHKNYTISLYHLDQYFVEVWSKGGLRISTSFKETTRAISILEPYLENSEIKELLDQLK